MLIERDLLAQITPFLLRKEYLAIVGPRQGGKTTLLELIKNYLMGSMGVAPDLIHQVTFEDRLLLQHFEKDAAGFVRSYATGRPGQTHYLMIDEFQYAEDGGQKLKLVYDTVPGVKIIVTGSSSLELKAKAGKYMVGRMLTFTLYHFSFGEFLRARFSPLAEIYRTHAARLDDWLNGKDISFASGAEPAGDRMLLAFDEYCCWGGYPAAVLAETDMQRHKIIADIFSNYMLKDIGGLLALPTEKNLMHLAQLLAAQTGGIVVYQNLGQAAGLDFRKLKDHLKILQETFIIEEAGPYFKNRQKELSRNPKIYFLDTGMRNYLVESMNALSSRPDAGALVENAVFVWLHQRREREFAVRFWHTKAGAEVDFVLMRGQEVTPVEVKFSGFNQPQISKSFAAFLAAFAPSRGLVLTKNYWGMMKKDATQILFAPVYFL